MSSDVSKINQESVATKLYDNIVNKKIWFLSKSKKEEIAVKALTKTCSDFIADFEKVINDQNNYILEIEDINESMDSISNEYDEKIKTIEKEIKELKQKEANGSITEEESNRLYSLYNEINSLTGDCNSILSTKKDALISKNSARRESYSDKELIATDFGQTTVDKGTSLTKDEDKKEIGEKAVKTGNTLLSIVGDAKATENKINTKLKR